MVPERIKSERKRMKGSEQETDEKQMKIPVKEQMKKVICRQ